MADLVDHPDFVELALPARRERTKVNLMTAPAAIDAVVYRRYRRAGRRVRARCRRAVRRDVHDRGVAGHRCFGDGEPALRLARGVRACGRGCAGDRVPNDRRPRSAAADRRTGSRARTPHAVRRSAARRVPGVGRDGRRRHQLALEGIDPAEVRLHVCWGNYEGPHTHDVDFGDIQPLLYEAHVGALVLSMANARHAHEYQCFERRPLPDGMVLVAGVIDTTSNYVEHPEVVADRLIRVAAPSATRGGSSPAPTAASTRRPASATWPRRSSGRSCARCAPAPTSRPPAVLVAGAARAVRCGRTGS